MECLFCSNKFRGEQHQEIHCRKHTLERPYLCPKCPKELTSKHCLKNHLETHKPIQEREVKTQICGICNKAISYNYLKRHRELVHKKNKRHGCHLCGKKFGIKSHLNRHLKTHAAQREQFKCEKCSKTFLLKISYEEHQLIHLDQEYSFQCDKCDLRYLSLRKLKSHKSQIHLEKAHVSVCVFCEKKFRSFSHLEEHLPTHTRERIHFCRLCPEEFRKLELLRIHKRRLHSKTREQYKCQLCPKSFLLKVSLNNHIREHTGELCFECPSPACKMLFPTYNLRKQHFLEVHVGKQFSCTTCEKKFLTKWQLNWHALSHSDFRGYKCDMCDSSFKNKSKLRRHKGTAHKVKVGV